MNFTRTFGIEIEALAPRNLTREQVAAAITALGVRCFARGYGHTVEREWSVRTDGSLSDQIGGMEIISPPLSGDAGFRAIETVCSALGELGMRIDRSCGLHVHIDARRPTPLELPTLKRLAILYSESEAIIDTILPPSRRGNANVYCRSLTNVSPRAIMNARDVNGIAAAIAPDTNTQRYVKLNFTAWWRYGTVEFRHHSGTLDAGKISKWVVACLRMIETAQNEPMRTADAVERIERVARTARRGSKLEVLYQMLMRPEGCTANEAMRAVGWNQISVPSAARRINLPLRQERVRELQSDGRYKSVYRYWGAPGTVLQQQQSAEVRLNRPTTLNEFADRIGMSDEERLFWQQRAALFATPSLNVAA